MSTILCFLINLNVAMKSILIFHFVICECLKYFFIKIFFLLLYTFFQVSLMEVSCYVKYAKFGLICLDAAWRMDWDEEIKYAHVFVEGRTIQIHITFEENFLKQNPGELGTYYKILKMLWKIIGRYFLHKRSWWIPTYLIQNLTLWPWK